MNETESRAEANHRGLTNACSLVSGWDGSGGLNERR
jgi:hypothetical protein